MLFDYYTPRDSIAYKSILSTFVSQNDFWYSNREEFQLISAQEINLIDRSAIAEMFIEERKKKYNQGVHCQYKVIREVANIEVFQCICQYIDLVIPRHYMVLLREQELGKRINRNEYRRNYRGITCVPEMKFFYENNYLRDYNKYSAQKARVQQNSEFRKLNHPYEKFSNGTLYRIVLQDAKISGCKLLKDKKDLKRLELLRLLHYFYWDRPMQDIGEYIEFVNGDGNKVISDNDKGRINMLKKGSKEEGDSILDRGISKLYCKYTGTREIYNEDVDLVLGMRYGQNGVQPCHSGCEGVCESSSGDSLCMGYLGCTPIYIKGTELYIVKCSLGVKCAKHRG